MLNIENFIRITESIDDNLFWKLDKWFERFPKQKSQFIKVVNNYKAKRQSKEELSTTLKRIHFDVDKFIDFVSDNLDDNHDMNYEYLMIKVIETILADKRNKYNIENDESY